MLETMKAMVRDHNTCVLATANTDGQPHTSLMTYSWGNDGLALYFVTRKQSRKFQNISKNPKVSVMIDTRPAACSSDEKTPLQHRAQITALTVTGLAQEVQDAPFYTARQHLLEINPGLRTITTEENTAVIKVLVSEFLLLQGVDKANKEKLHIVEKNA